ncbi:MAG: SusC/RagA family TonB-linked outer membrane protein [Chitinophagia bacterium]|jgi:TonB-linked SusC/RagA family outer membrane protein|nr:SusC/RagA family TonB-linked outer membrane protein [Chitinophagia bacterium]
MQKKGVCILLLMLFLGASVANAQQKQISGKVVSTDNAPLSNVSVVVKGTRTSTSTDNNGSFSITAGANQTLTFSLVGYDSKDVRVGNSTTLNVKLSAVDNTLEEVVVTAMDIRRNPKELGYSVQKLKGQDLAETQRNNIVNSLQGRVAGLTINPTSGLAGASSQIVLRGFNSLALDNSPLFIVDGIIVDNQSIQENNRNTGFAVKPTSANVSTENRSNDYTNRVADINPNDIENVTVLKGPEATALYGSQASSGAIVITTKKGTTSDGKMKISYDNSFRTSVYVRYPKMMTDFDTGANGIQSDIFSYFGQKFTSEVPRYGNLRSFFQPSSSKTHNLSLEMGTKTNTIRFSGSFLDENSPVPNNNYKKYNFRVVTNHKIGKTLEISPSFSIINSGNDKPLRGVSGYLMSLMAWPDDDNAKNWISADGLKKPLFNTNPNGELDNPYFNVYKNRSKDELSRSIATLAINYNPTKWLSINGRVGYDTYSQNGYTKWDSASYFLSRAQKGAQENYYRKYYGYNHTVTATAKKSFGKINTRLMIGNMWQDYETQTYAIFGNDIADALRTDSGNTNPITRIRNSNATRFGLPNYNISRQAAYFGEASVNYDNKIFFTYSHRFEESSIFPVASRSYDYPAGSVSMILSDIFPAVKSKLNYWKLRGSLASTARSSAPYANQAILNFNTGSGGGYYYDFTNANPYLTPERQKTFEVGSEFKFKGNRLSAEITYYKTENKDLIAENFRASYGTGYVLNTLNVGANENTGIEMVLDYQLFNTKDFSWNTRFNFNRMRNKVTALPDNVPEFYISDTWVYGNARGGLTRGGATTTITSYGYARNTAGQILIDPATGIPVLDNNFRVRGDRNPDFSLGWLNNITYKDLRISFLWDLKVGGDVFNATEMYLTRIGRSQRTADRMTPRVITGILKDGLENTATPTQNSIAIVPYYQQTYFTTMPEEEFIQKNVNAFRLRDLSFNYNIKKFMTEGIARYTKTMSAFLTINDLILITNYKGADPAVGANSAGSRGVGGFGFDYANMGAPVSFNMGIRTTF